MSLKLITPPASEPVTLTEVKSDLRITHDADDARIGFFIQHARGFCEDKTGRALMAQTWEKTYDSFPDAIELARLPVASVTTIKYTDENSVEQTLSASSYVLDNASDDRSAWIVPAEGYAWPDTYTGINGVRVRFVAGYADADAVPGALKQWIHFQVRYWYDQGLAAEEDQIKKMQFVDNLLDAYRIWSL